MIHKCFFQATVRHTKPEQLAIRCVNNGNALQFLTYASGSQEPSEESVQRSGFDWSLRTARTVRPPHLERCAGQIIGLAGANELREIIEISKPGSR